MAGIKGNGGVPAKTEDSKWLALASLTEAIKQFGQVKGAFETVKNIQRLAGFDKTPLPVNRVGIASSDEGTGRVV
ncbi:MAG: hypothetical protein NTZ10_03730 [Candidatus Saganbacteria bacterium]|nr:hypothetical protein [Candidatus Saganbacteria bacterium]